MLYLVVQSCPTLCDPMKCSPPVSSPWEFSRQEYWSGLPCLPPGDLPNPGIKPRSPTLQADSLPSEPPGKPKNIGVGSLSLRQWIFPTQESNWGLLHCRWILYQLSYQGSPVTVIKVIIIFDQYFLSVVYVSAMYVYVLSHVQLFVTPWSVACQASLSMEFSRQEY